MWELSASQGENILVFITPFTLSRRMHNDQERSHLCQECGSMFTEKTHLMSHIAYVHKLSKEDSFCYTCGLTIKTATGKSLSEALFLHQLTHNMTTDCS